MIALSNQHVGALFAISSGLCYGLVGFFGVSFIEAGYSVSAMLFWRFFVATVCVGVMLLPQIKQVFTSGSHAVKAFLYGLLFYGTSTTLYFMASQYIGTGLAMVILFTFPAMVMLINMVVYKATIRKMYVVAFGLMLLGMVFLVNPNSFSFDLYGIGLGVLSAVLYACYIAASKHINLSPLVSTLMVSAGCMSTSLIHSITENSFRVPQELESWLWIIAMGTICTAIPILLLLQGFKYISSEKASMLSVLEPVFVVFFGILLLGEEVSAQELLGVFIILSGAMMTLFIESSVKQADKTI
ncbi:MAG: DMT family transporter [Chlamydiales bacterium]|nr:DMT family transporter [Chlamydiales bacterium]